MSQVSGQPSAHLSIGLRDANDLFAVVEVELENPNATSLVVLDQRNSMMTVGTGQTVLWSGSPGGSLSFGLLHVSCELSDVYLDTGGSWECSTDVDATLDLTAITTLGSVQIGGVVSQREALSEACNECSGIEGCEY